MDRSNLPPDTGVTITADGSNLAVTDFVVARIGLDRYWLVVAPAIRQGEAVIITYTDPTGNDDANAFQDTTGNDAATFTTGEDSVPGVTNNSTRTNNAPTAANGTVTTRPNTNHTFSAANFNFMDQDADPLSSVKIVTLPTTGTLTFSGTAIPSGDLPKTVTASDLSARRLQYAPPTGQSGSALASFTFRVNDGTADSAAASTMTINVAQNTPPVAASNTVMTRQDTQYSFFISDFNYSDADGDWQGWNVKILTLPSKGTLKHDTRSISAGYEMHWTDLGRQALKYDPPAGESGAGLGSFTFKVNDRRADSIATYTMTVDVAASGSAQPETEHCDTSDTNELWCATITVGDEGGGYYGYGILGFHGSIAPSNRFNHGSHIVRVDRLVYGGSNRRLFFGVASASGWTPNGLLGTGNFKLEFGTGSSKRSVDIINPGMARDFRFRNHGLNWSVGQKVPVKFLRTTGNQVVVDPPSVTSTPAISAAGGDSQWTVGETVEVTLEFSEAVVVGTTGGIPSVTLAITGGQMRRAGYVRGTGTTELVFSYELISGDGAHTSMGVSPDSLTLNGGTIRSVATSVDATLAHNGAFVAGGAGRNPEGPTARFSNLPANHDGTTAFTVELHFSAEPEGLSYSTVAGGMLEVEGGAVTRAERATRGSNMGWRVTVAPSGEGDVEIELPARKCGKPNAVCIGGRPLERAAQATVAGTASVEPPPPPEPPTPPEVPLTASFSGAPAEHAGSGSFELQFRLSEEPAGLSYRTVQSGLFNVTGASIGRAWRLQKGTNQGWGLRVEPSGFGDVTLVVRATTDCAGTPGVCTSDGRMLGGGLQARIAGPPTLSVADAEVDENTGATLDFDVTLNRAVNETVTVGYGTADVSASAGADYTSMSGTLTFAAQETSKTVSVPVLDDVHDEGSETMTLRLSSPTPARVKLADAQATGTINNQDPMPLAWMVRFGRTVGSHVVDALSTRLEGASGSHVTVAGINVIGAKGDEPVLTDDDPFGLPEWAKNAEREADGEALTADDILLRSAFHLSSGGDGTQGGGPAFTAWGRVATGGFEAEADNVTMDGDVTTGLIGFDAEWERALAGIMLSQSKGEGSYRLDAEHSNDAGTVESSLTGVYPYMRVDLNRQVSAWALAGAGSGELTLHRKNGSMPTDISMRMGAVGVKGQVLDGSGPSGVGLNVKSDAMWVGTKSEDTDELAPTEGDVTRLRLIVQGERVFEAGNGATFTPSAEIGLRHDGGDAETGTGVEIGGGLRYIAGPLTIEGQVRMLVAHEESGYEEWGASGAIRMTPSASGRGLTLSIAPAWGRTGSATERLWSAHDARGLGADNEFEAAGQLAMDAGYGVGLPGNRGVLTPYAGMTLGDAGARTMRTGTRWQLGPDATFGLEGSRQASDAGEADNRVTLRAALRF